MSSQRQKNLSKDELEQYDVLLEEQAFPFEEKAIKLHEVNAARARDGAAAEFRIALARQALQGGA